MLVSSASSFVRTMSIGLVAGAIAISSSAIAQQKQPAAKKPVTAAPAQPAAPAVAAPAATPAAAATIVQLKPEPSQASWIKICGEDQESKKKICYTTRDFVSDQNQPVLAVAVYDVQGDPQKIVRFLLPLGFILAPGIRFAADNGAPQPGKFVVCFPNGCFAEVSVKDDIVAAMKKSTTMAVSVQNQFSREVAFQVPLADFGKVFDGPPIDPAILAAEQKRLQDQMQKQAEEMRKKMGDQAPAPGTPPVAPAASAPAAPAPAAPAQ